MAVDVEKFLMSRRRFGMKPGLEAISRVCAEIGHPERHVRAIHVAGTNGKGAVCAILDAALRARGLRIGRYTSPHLVAINERFFCDGTPISDAALAGIVERLADPAWASLVDGLTYFEALTAAAFVAYAEAGEDYTILETGLGGRLDATNICSPGLTIITRIGLDHCDWLGDTIEKIAAEKAGIIKPGVPIVLGKNDPAVQAVVQRRANEVGAPYYYAPELASESEIPSDFSLRGTFNRENAVTAIAALRILCNQQPTTNNQQLTTNNQQPISGFSQIVWPGRFQQVGRFIVDGAHNPPAAKALAESLAELNPKRGAFDLIAGFCGDKEVEQVLRTLAPHIRRAYAVQTNNPRSLTAAETAAKMQACGISAIPCNSLQIAVSSSGDRPQENQQPTTNNQQPTTNNQTGDRPRFTVICGSLFLAGEALVELGAYPWTVKRFDLAEKLK